MFPSLCQAIKRKCSNAFDFRPTYLSSYRPATTPGKYTIPVYRRIQLAKVDTSPPLSPTETTELQEIVSTLLYYARAVDPALLPISNEIASQQASPTAEGMAAANKALSYAAGHSTNAIIYHASDMILFSHVDASYLSRSHARSVAGAYFFLGNRSQPLKIDGVVHVSKSLTTHSPTSSSSTAPSSRSFRSALPCPVWPTCRQALRPRLCPGHLK